MAMKKAEMEAHQEQYYSLMRQVREAERQGLYRGAIDTAIAAWEHVDGMMQFERKFQETQVNRIGAFDVVLRYAPVLFHMKSILSLERFLKENPRIGKNTSADLSEDLDKAKRLMWNAHRLWDHIENNPECRQDTLRRHLGGDQDMWRSVSEIWERMGFLLRVPEAGSYRLSLVTRMGQIVPGKCQSCGATAEAPKAMFLEQLTCPDCRKQTFFTILETEVSTAGTE